MTSKKIISADSHVIEPPNLWLDYIEPEFKSRAPHCERENDKDVFKCDGGVSLIQVGAVSAAGRPVDEVSNLGNYESDAPKGAYDSSARVGEIATDGVEAEVLYPSIALRMFAIADVPYQLACFRAYNSWMADFMKPYPDTFKGIGLIPIDDIEAAVGELHRCKEIGLAGVSVAVSTDPETTYDKPHFDPLWAAAEAAGMPISLHILTERRRAAQTTDSVARLANGATECFAIQDALARMIFGGVFHRYPGLRIVSAENDIGWAAYFTERIDYLFDRRRPFHTFVIPRDTLPSEYMKRNAYLTFMRDRSGILSRAITGVDNLMWSTDYPHLDSTWPKSRQMIDRLVGDIPEDEAHKIIAGNAARLYDFN